jgi:hypothetical protein
MLRFEDVIKEMVFLQHWNVLSPSDQFFPYHTSSETNTDLNNQATKMTLRSPTFLMGLANLFAIGGATYHLRSHHIYNLEEHEARMDELEGTLRGHIGLIEESLERLEGKQITKGQKT